MSTDPTPAVRWTVRTLLGVLALGLGSWLYGLEAGVGREGRIEALEVAEWLRDHPSQIRVVDLRTEEAYADFHLPRAERSSPETVSEMEISAQQIAVLYGDDPRVVRAAWARLDRAGVRVRYMEMGIEEWTDQILSPILPADAGPERRAAFDRQAEVARFFGGFPRIGVVLDTTDTASERLSRIRRRGCGF